MNNFLVDGAMVVTPQKQMMAAGTNLDLKKEEVHTDLKKDHHNSHSLSYFGLPYQDHNYGAPPPPTPPQSPPHYPEVKSVLVEPEKPVEELKKEESSDEEKEEDEEQGSETNKDEGITRCICDFEHDDGYMICCDKCLVWQHVECMGLDRSNIPDNYFCEKCEPRKVDVETAKALQSKKKKHLEELQKKEEKEGGKAGKRDDTIVSLKSKKKVKKKKKKKEKEKDKEEDGKEDRKKEKKKKKKDRERADSHSSDVSENARNTEEGNGRQKEASLIQCTPEVEELMEEFRKNPEMFLAGAATYHGSPEDMKRIKACVGQVGKNGTNGVVSLEQIPANQPIMQLAGTLSLRDKKKRNHSKQLESFMFVYTSFCNTELILDASSQENVARFTRKSCSPNAEIRHMIFDGVVQLYLFALKDIGSNTEVTLGLDFDYTAGPHPVKCACGKKSCPVKKYWHKQKSNGIKDKTGNSDDEVKGNNATKKVSPLKLGLSKQSSYESPKNDSPAEKQQESKCKSEPATPRGEESDTANAPKPAHKMTREERKMDAIMKAFERLEKSQQRRQQTLERMAQTREKQGTGDGEKDTSGKVKVDVEETSKEQSVLSLQKPKSEAIIEDKGDESNDVNVTEQDEIQALVPQVSSKPKARSQRKKKKGSRKRSRNSSGASSTSVSVEVSSADDEPSLPHIPAATSSSTCLPSCPPSGNVSSGVATSSSSLLSVQTNFNSSTENSLDSVSLASPAANSKHFKFPKTKRFFMNEWLNEKAQEASADSPLTVKTENIEPVVSAINSPSAAAIRERAPSLDVSFGSAKKRWLRQAMQETSQTGSNGSNSPVCNGGASPVMPQGVSPAVSPNSNSMDFMTPLKKRMLRHSLAEERPFQHLSPKQDVSIESLKAPIPAPADTEQPQVTVKEEDSEKQEKPEEKETESPSKLLTTTPPFHLPLPARKGFRKNSSVDSGMSVTTPADMERSSSFPSLSDNPANEMTAVRKLDLGKKEDEVQKQVDDAVVDSVTPVESETPMLPSKDIIDNSETSSVSPIKETGTTGSPEKLNEADCQDKPKEEEKPKSGNVGCSVPLAGQVFKRSLSDELSISNGEINPAYFSPKKRHLYLRQNTDPGRHVSAERPLGGTWPRQDFTRSNQGTLPKVSEDAPEIGPLSSSWSGPAEKSIITSEGLTSSSSVIATGSSGPPHSVDASTAAHTMPLPTVSGSSVIISSPDGTLHTPGNLTSSGPGSLPHSGLGSIPASGPGSLPSPGPGSLPSPGAGGLRPPGSGVPPTPGPGVLPLPGPSGLPPPGNGGAPAGVTYLDPRIGGKAQPPPGHGAQNALTSVGPNQNLSPADPRYPALDVRTSPESFNLLGLPHPADPRLRLEDGQPSPFIYEDTKYLSPNPAGGGSVSAPTTPSKKKVSLLEYRKRKSVSATKKPNENQAPEEESKEIADVTPKQSEESSPASSTGSTPEKPSKPANIITFKDKKLQAVDSTTPSDGLQSLPLFSKAPIAESPEGKKLSLTDEAHKLITSLTQVLMEGKPHKDKIPSQMMDPAHTNEDPLQRMRRELNEKNKEKVLALKRAHSPEPPPPPPEKKSRLDAASPPVPPPPPPRNIPPYVTGIHSPKAGGIQRPANHAAAVVVNPSQGPVIGVPQVGTQTNGGHVVYPPVIHGAGKPTPSPSAPSVVTQYQQPIGKHQVHSPRGQNHYSPGAASTSPRGVGPPVAHATPHPNSFQYQHNNHVEDTLVPRTNQHQLGQYQNYNGDQGGFHVNGEVVPHQYHSKSINHHNLRDGSRKSVDSALSRPSGGQYPSGKYQPAALQDKRSQSSPYGRSSRALSPRRSYHRH